MERIVISQLELKVIILKDVKNLSDKECANILNISKSEFRKLLFNTRKKIASSIIDNEEITIYKEPEIIEEICSTKCKFRCATCSKVYEINYTKEAIVCPLCGSEKIMKIEEMGNI